MEHLQRNSFFMIYAGTSVGLFSGGGFMLCLSTNPMKDDARDFAVVGLRGWSRGGVLKPFPSMGV